ncbi:hypothetical protein CBR_g66650 [Chara braunii]|uniref:Integrase catalytic domain-containing protein n=1 Tax=Chara braunii TaxID=69332 RepID=A0A388JPY7_CHABU|nr:hypothetical protein CBR_g66650 [Chara braunii]|eukprot:GBG59847.1 hypothetical protein CBR_g66650 [Chara braunii]
MTQDEDESVRSFGMRFQKISDVLMKKRKILEIERCTIFIGHLSKGRQKSVLRDLPRDKLDFPEVLKLTIKAEADDYKDLVWRGMRRRDFSLYKEYATDRCPDFKDHPWSEKNEVVAEEVKEIRDMVKGLTRQVTEIVTTTGPTTYQDKPGGPYSLRWDRRNTDSWRSVEDRNPRTLTDYRARERERDDESWQRRDDEIDRDCRTREMYGRARRLNDYSCSPRYEPDGGRGDSQGRWESDQGRRDGYRDGRYERLDRDGHRDDRYQRSHRDGYRDGRYERSDRDGRRDDRYERSDRDNYRGGRYERGDRPDDSRGRYDRGDRREDSCGRYDRGDRRDNSRGRYDRGDRRDDSRGGYEHGDHRNDSRGRNERRGYGASSDPYPKSPDPRAARGSTSRGIDDRPPTPRNSCVYCRGDDHIKRDCPDLQRAIDEGLVLLDDRKYVKWADDLGDVSMFPSMKKNVEARRVKSSKGKEPVRSQSIKITFEGDMATTPIRVAATRSARGCTSKKTDTDYCSILEYLAASKPARDELQMITRKTHIPLSEEAQGAPKADAPTVAVTGVTTRADRMATVLLDGMEGVPPDKFYILGSEAVETIINDRAVLDAVIDNGSEAVIIDEDLAVQVGLGLDRSYLFEIETVDGRKQQITGVCHKAAIEVQGVRVTLPVFAVKNCNSDLLLGRTWLSHVHAVTIERVDGSQTLSIKKLDGTRVVIETVEPRDPRNRATLAVGARPSDQIKSLPISGRAVRFREKKYGPLLTEEKSRIVEMENLGSRLIVDDNSYPKETDEEFGGVVSVSFLRARPPMGDYSSDTRWKYAQKEKEEVIAFLKEKMVFHVAEPSDSAYANRWFKFRWIQDLQKVNAVTIRDELAMQELKDEFKEGGRVLGVPFFDDEAKRPFIVSTDVGPCLVGGLLSQKDAEGKERPLRFESKTLNTEERNYSQFKKEVLAVLRCLDMFRHYIYGRRFTLRVNPTSVASVLQKDFSLTDPTIARWLIRIRLYDYTVERISNTKNAVADGLSRIPLEAERPIVAGVLTLAEPRRAERFLVNLYEGKYRTIGLHLSGEESRESDIRRQAAQYCLRAGHLFRRPVDSGMPLRVVCDSEERQMIVAELHNGVVGGHRGVKRTDEKERRLYWWEGQYKDVERYCMTCEECQKRALVKYKEPLHPSYPTRPGEKVHIDLVKMPKRVGNMNYIVNIRDDFTGFVDGRPIRSKTAKEVKNFVLEYLSRCGCVSKIVMDRGTEFLADEVQSVFKRAGARVSIATAYHPESNSPVERGHQTLITSLSKWCKGKDSDWPRYFRYAIWAVNVTVRASTGYPPYTLWFGRHCPLPIEFHVDSWTTVDWAKEMSREEHIAARTRQIAYGLEDNLMTAADRLAVERDKGKERWDKNVRIRKERVSVGDMLLLYDEALERTWTGKLANRWMGPYRVVEALD